MRHHAKEANCTPLRQEVTQSHAEDLRDLLHGMHHGIWQVYNFPGFADYCRCIKKANVGTSTVLVISPLLSLMKEQTAHVNETFGICAAGIFDGQEEDIMQNIEDGVYSLLYTTPAGLLGNRR